MKEGTGMKRTPLGLAALTLVTLVCLPIFAPSVTSSAAPPPTVVTIQFDDGNANQYTARAILSAHGMHATFYVNSGVIEDGTHLTWSQLTDLAGDGNEIASHTLFHTNIKKLKTTAARQAVCGDRVNLFNHGFQAVSFAYPFGSFDAGSEAVVQACGFNSGRGVSGVNDRRVFAEAIPPLDAYATRTPPNPKQSTTLTTIEGYVTAAEANGGGWVQLVFHNICSGCDAYSITQDDFTSLLTWLQSQGSAGVAVETTAQVIGGPVQPLVQP
jgi:peptidoglycan/xylan/chitin deacetylase (PgdA/CDA1 family)